MGCSHSPNCPVSESPNAGRGHLEQRQAGSSDQLNDVWDSSDMPISPVDDRPAPGVRGHLCPVEERLGDVVAVAPGRTVECFEIVLDGCCSIVGFFFGV